MNIEVMIKKAFEVRENAYSPYSSFKVGACIALKNGDYVCGCNIENAAYGSSMCAERNAIFSTYCQGYHRDDIMALVIVADCEPLASPCGACRQVLSELMNPETPVILANKKRHEVYTINDLVPLMFIGESL